VMQQMPNDLMRIVDRDPDSLQALRRIADQLGCDRIEAGSPESLNDVLAVRRRTIAAIMATRAIEINAPVTAESRKLAARHEALLREHSGLVRRIAYHLFRRRHYVNVEDLIQAGMVGLLEAIRGHRLDTPGSFEAYASVRIRGAMLDFVRTSDWSLRSVRRDLRSIEEANSAS
jgi:DNA-directed RNA polymerase sigma subunit (sigma70/sigma32)